LIFGLPFSPVNRTQAEGIDISQELSDVEELSQIDFRKGRFLIVLFDTECEHCMDSVPDIDFLYEDEVSPRLVALCPNDEKQIAVFIEQYQPVFPVEAIREDSFWKLLGDGDLPRVILINDQRTLKIWDMDVPDPMEVTLVQKPSSIISQNQ
jgi:hypothetical protein